MIELRDRLDFDARSLLTLSDGFGDLLSWLNFNQTEMIAIDDDARLGGLVAEQPRPDRMVEDERLIEIRQKSWLDLA